MTEPSKKDGIHFTRAKYDSHWEHLVRKEKTRRSLIQKVDGSFWSLLYAWQGTILSMICRDILFWFTLAVYLAMRIYIHYVNADNQLSYLDSLDNKAIAIVGTFISLTMVFYVNQTNSRYFMLYDASMAGKGRIFDSATLAVTHLPYAHASRLVRYMNAAHLSAYVGMSDTYEADNYFNHVNRNMGLLTPQERERLDQIGIEGGTSAFRELITWCMNEVQTAKDKALLDMFQANQLRRQVLGLQMAMGALFNAKDLPIPFVYVHFLCLVQAIYLPLFAVTSAISAGTGPGETHWTAGALQGIVLILKSAFLIGMRLLGQKMSDPYGDNLIDLSVMFYVHHTWLHSHRVLTSAFPEPAEAAVEERLAFRRDEKLGDAWESTTKGPELHSTDFVSSDYEAPVAEIPILERQSSRESESVEASYHTKDGLRMNQMESRIVKNPQMSTR